MTKTASHDKQIASVEAEMEKLRVYVIEARSDATVEAAAHKTLDKLNALYKEDKDLFTPEQIRWANVMCGYLAQRLAKHQPKGEHTQKAKRKGDTLLNCWRCETMVDERFTDICPTCSVHKGYQWRTCPICKACGCQREGKVLV